VIQAGNLLSRVATSPNIYETTKNLKKKMRESVTFRWNEWSHSFGIDGYGGVEYALARER